jgi:hypothetical protein
MMAIKLKVAWSPILLNITNYILISKCFKKKEETVHQTESPLFLV